MRRELVGVSRRAAARRHRRQLQRHRRVEDRGQLRAPDVRTPTIGSTATVGVIRDGSRLELKVPIVPIQTRPASTQSPHAVQLARADAGPGAGARRRVPHRRLRRRASCSRCSARSSPDEREARVRRRPAPRHSTSVIFLITAAALSFPALTLAGYQDQLHRQSRSAAPRGCSTRPADRASSRSLAYLIDPHRLGRRAPVRARDEPGTGLDVIERTKRAQTLGRLLQNDADRRRHRSSPA